MAHSAAAAPSTSASAALSPASSDPGRSRAGNAMARTRAAVLFGARQCLVKHGSRKTTMVDIAATAGVAKATLYNHFRAKSEVYVALIHSEVRQAGVDTIEAAEAVGVATALARLAERLGEHPVIRRLAAQEPGVLGGLVLPEQAGDAGVIWQAARDALATLVAGQADVELVLRFLVSQLLWPASRDETVAAVTVLLGSPSPEAAPVTPELTSELSSRAAMPDVAPVPSRPGLPVVPGLGWPEGKPAAERVGVV